MKKHFSVSNFSARRESSPPNLDYCMSNLQNQPPGKQPEPAACQNKYIVPGESLVERVGQLQSMYEQQINSLTQSLKEKDQYNCELLRRMRELEKQNIMLEKKILELSKETNNCMPDVLNENRMLRNFIETHIQGRISAKKKKHMLEDNTKSAMLRRHASHEHWDDNTQ